MSLLGTWLPPLRPSQQVRFGWGRVDAFLDAVYAIAATLLVLELRPPEAEDGHLASALLDQWPIYLVYALGFVQIVVGWGVVRRLSSWCGGLDHYAMLLAMLALLTFTMQPFTFAVLAGAVDNRDDFVTGIRLLSKVLSLSIVAFSSLMVYLRRRNFFRTDILDPRLFEMGYRAAATAWVWPVMAFALSFVIGPWALVPIVIFTLISAVPIDALPVDAEPRDAA